MDRYKSVALGTKFLHNSAPAMAGLASDYQPNRDPNDIGTTPRRIIYGLLAIVAGTWIYFREVDLAAYPGGNWVLALGVFVVLLRTLPH